jgi:beta-lactamase regulating signal transducer with metallopeptidase domain
MESQLYWIYAFNIVVNSTLAFFTSILLIEFFVCLFRVKHPRIKVFCRILPFFKICLDLCLYHVSKWALLHGVNPILAEKGTRQLSLLLNPFTGIQFSMKNGKTFSVADVIALIVDPIWIQEVVCIAGFGSIVASLLYLKRIPHERRQIAMMIAQAASVPVKDLHPSLISWIKQKQITIVTSDAISSPCIVEKAILFPVQLFQELSEKEIEAIIAHEMAHFGWKDCIIRIACSLIASVFWWIPTKWWQKRLEDAQEQASDTIIHRFGISGTVLAGAILKTAREAKVIKAQLAFSFVGGKSPLKKRMELLLREPSRFSRWKIVQYGLLALAWLSILFGTLWIF